MTHEIKGVDGWVIRTPKERQGVEEMRILLNDFEGDATLNTGDACLVRFLRAQHGHVNKAVKMFRNAAEWRKNKKPIEIAMRYDAPQVIRQYRPGGILGRDKTGAPVFYDRIGQVDASIVKHCTKEELEHFEIQKQELLTEIFKKCSQVDGREHHQQLVVNDLAGLGMGHLSKNAISVVQAIIPVLDNYYPMRFTKMIIINPPFVFNVGWNLIKPFINESTKAQIEVVQGDPSKILLQYIDKDQLPKSLGGNLVINGDPYCGDIIIKGGKIPKDYQGYPATYREDRTDLPMEILVPVRQSFKRPTPSEEPELNFVASVSEWWTTTISSINDWVQNADAAEIETNDEKLPELKDEIPEEEIQIPVSNNKCCVIC